MKIGRRIAGTVLLVTFSVSVLFSLPAFGQTPAPVGGGIVGPAAGDSTRPHFSMRWKLPDWQVQGGELTVEGDQPMFPKPFELGFWGGGRASMFFLPLSDRLVPIAQDRKLRAFDDYMFMIGARFWTVFAETLRLSVYFDTGFQSREDRVAHQDRSADVNLTRLGMAFEIQAPLSKLDEIPGAPISLAVPPALANIRVGIGLEIGFGNLNLTMRGDDLPRDRHANAPFFYLTPECFISLPFTSFFRLELAAGFNFVTFNSLSREFYFEDQKMVSGTEFNGGLLAIQFLFGADSVSSLSRSKPQPWL